MTVATKVEKALAHLHQAQAAFEEFSLDTKNKQAKSMYGQAAKETEGLAQSLEQRLNQIQDEEPSYRNSTDL